MYTHLFDLLKPIYSCDQHGQVMLADVANRAFTLHACCCRLKLQLPGSTTTPADAPRPQLSTAVFASAVLGLTVLLAWARLQHN